MSVEDGVEEPDALEKFNELFGDLGDTIMGATEPPQANEKGTRKILTPITHSTALNFLRRRVKSRAPSKILRKSSESGA